MLLSARNLLQGLAARREMDPDGRDPAPDYAMMPSPMT
jgi:hypothetical protein